MLLVAYRWLEEAYPDSPSIFRPEASLPIDVNSPQHLAAVAEAKEFGERTFLSSTTFELS